MKTGYVTVWEWEERLVPHHYKDVETCSVVNGDCLSPANQEFPKTPARYECFCCGLPVCRNCSKKMDYLTFGVQRICDECREELERHKARKNTHPLPPRNSPVNRL